MRTEIVNHCDASVSLIPLDLRKRAVDDDEAKARRQRLKDYDDAKRKEEQDSKKEKAKTTEH